MGTLVVRCRDENEGAIIRASGGRKEECVRGVTKLGFLCGKSESEEPERGAVSA